MAESNLLKIEQTNKYDKLLIIFIVLQIFGILGGALQPIRLFVIIFTPFLLASLFKDQYLMKNYGYELIAFGLWIIYGLISILWVLEPSESIKDVFYLLVNFIGFFLFILFASKAKCPKESIIKAWLILFILTIPIAIIELRFNKHLPSTFHSDPILFNIGRGIFMERRFASVTYGNLNGYNTILVYILPFIVGNNITTKSSSFTIRVINWLLVVILSYIIIANSSRSAFLCLLICLFIFLCFYVKNIKRAILTGFLFTVTVVIFLSINKEFIDAIFIRIQEQGLEDKARGQLIHNGIDLLLESSFMGIGAGNFMPFMLQKYKLSLIAPHNLFLEVIVQYGIIIFGLFIGIIIRIIRSNMGNKNKKYNFIVIASLIIYPLSSIINSGYILNISTWLLLSSLYVISDKKYDVR
ncbi:MAG TPA: hypothetical protein DIC46_10075 [Porphyromonadaceae bacterium]|jgi:hypothetical protein|nr:hypothetical protein [Porphyromonadaceae bacterium]